MTRVTRLFAAGLAAAIAVGAPVAAQSNSLRAEFAVPFAEASKVIIDGRRWSCSGTACTAAGSDPRLAVACRKLARKLGAVARFEGAQGALDEAGLATCNQDQK